MESLCLKKLKDIGGTGNARELAQALDQPMANISPRLRALELAGLIRDTGRRESVGRGRPLKVYVVCDRVQTIPSPVTVQGETEAQKFARVFNAAPAWFKNYGT